MKYIIHYFDFVFLNKKTRVHIKVSLYTFHI